MQLDILNYKKIKKKYLIFLKSQEVMSEPFRDKIGQLNKFYLPISKMINDEYLKDKKTKLIGLCGGQGSGKSTISNILKIILKEGFHLETVIFSIDDFYKTLNQRQLMSKNISYLFLTRGVPGTHDTSMLKSCIQNLKNFSFRKSMIPKFDKSNDDRCPKNKWLKVMIYTNNNGPKSWTYDIKHYIEKKLNYKLFDKIITAWKVNGKPLNSPKLAPLTTVPAVTSAPCSFPTKK